MNHQPPSDLPIILGALERMGMVSVPKKTDTRLPAGLSEDELLWAYRKPGSRYQGTVSPQTAQEATCELD